MTDRASTQSSRIHLSIDLDFWAGSNFPIGPAELFLEYVFKAVDRLRVYESHEQVLPQVNGSGCNILINLDFHSDFYMGSPDPNDNPENAGDGDWVDFVSWRKNGSFFWLPPCNDHLLPYGAGRCDRLWHRSPWPQPPIEHNQWKRVGYLLDPRTQIRWQDVQDVSVAISPDYLDTTPLSEDGIWNLLGITVHPDYTHCYAPGNEDEEIFIIESEEVIRP